MSATTTKSGKKTFEILLVEDNSGDVVLVKEALKESTVDVHLSVAEDGERAVDYLRKQDVYARAPDPDLIILDINLPKKNGFEVLREIRSIESLKSVPVVVLTTSRSNKDILKTYSLGGTCLITKPIGFYEYLEAIKSITANLLK